MAQPRKKNDVSWRRRDKWKRFADEDKINRPSTKKNIRPPYADDPDIDETAKNAKPAVKNGIPTDAEYLKQNVAAEREMRRTLQAEYQRRLKQPFNANAKLIQQDADNPKPLDQYLKNDTPYYKRANRYDELSQPVTITNAERITRNGKPRIMFTFVDNDDVEHRYSFPADVVDMTGLESAVRDSDSSMRAAKLSLKYADPEQRKTLSDKDIDNIHQYWAAKNGETDKTENRRKRKANPNTRPTNRRRNRKLDIREEQQNRRRTLLPRRQYKQVQPTHPEDYYDPRDTLRYKVLRMIRIYKDLKRLAESIGD